MGSDRRSTPQRGPDHGRVHPPGLGAQRRGDALGLHAERLAAGKHRPRGPQRRLGLAAEDAPTFPARAEHRRVGPVRALGDVFEEIGVVFADETSALVAAADQGRADRPAIETSVAKVHGSTDWDGGAAGHRYALEKAATSQSFADAAIVVLAKLFLFGGQ